MIKLLHLKFHFFISLVLMIGFIGCNVFGPSRIDSQFFKRVSSVGRGSSINCPERYIFVYGNNSLLTEDFCVMKYEARAWEDSNTNMSLDPGEIDLDGCYELGCTTSNWGSVSLRPISHSDGKPWRMIGLNLAWQKCFKLNTEGSNLQKENDDNLDGTYSLISNPEWMSLARDIQAVAENWKSLNIGSGHISRGHSDNDPSFVLPITDNQNSYSDTGNTSAETAGSGWEQKRTHSLSSGEVIWDLAGNVREWVDWEAGDTIFSLGPVNESSSIKDFGDAQDNSTLVAEDYLPAPIYTSTQSFGKWGGGTYGAAIRGGKFDINASVGIFTMILNLPLTTVTLDTGFRCVFRPAL